MNLGRQPDEAMLGLSCCGKARSGYRGILCARAAAPPPSSSQYSRENAMMLDNQTPAPAESSCSAELVAFPPWISTSMSRAVERQRVQDEDSDDADGQSPQQPRATVDAPRVVDDDRDEKQGLDRRQDPDGCEPHLCGSEHSQNHRSQHGSSHGPARLALDGFLRSGRLRFLTHASVRNAGSGRLWMPGLPVDLMTLPVSTVRSPGWVTGVAGGVGWPYRIIPAPEKRGVRSAHGRAAVDREGTIRHLSVEATNQRMGRSPAATAG